LGDARREWIKSFFFTLLTSDVQDVLKESITYEDEWQAEKTTSLPDPEQATSLSYSSAEVCLLPSTYLLTLCYWF